MTEHTLTFLLIFLFVLKVQNVKGDIKLNGKRLLWDIYEIFKVYKRQKMKAVTIYAVTCYTALHVTS